MPHQKDQPARRNLPVQILFGLALSILILPGQGRAQNVGINTTSPLFDLDVRGLGANNGSTIHVGNLDNSHFLRMYSGRMLDFPSPIIYWKDNDTLRFGSDLNVFTELMRITPTGRLSLGSSQPLEQLHVEGNAYFNGNKGIRLSAADSPLITRGWNPFTTGSYTGLGRWGLFMEPFYLTLGVPNIAGRGFRFVNYNEDSSISGIMMTLKEGKLGIGNNDPLYKLDIEDAQAVVRLVSTNTTNGSVLELRTTSFFDEQDFMGAINFSNPAGTVFGQIAQTHDGEMHIKSGGFERMRINTAGNLGIGTSSPQYKLDVYGDINTTGAFRANGIGGDPGQVLTSNGFGAPIWSTHPENPTIGFSATLEEDNFTSSGVINDLIGFDEVFDDGGNNFDPVLGEFTAPSSGLYFFVVHTVWAQSTMSFSDVPVKFDMYVGVNPAPVAGADKIIQIVSGYWDSVDLTHLIHLNQGEFVHFEVSQYSGGTVVLRGGLTSATRISGYKVY